MRMTSISHHRFAMILRTQFSPSPSPSPSEVIHVLCLGGLRRQLGKGLLQVSCSVRQEMHSLHSNDSQIVVLKHNVRRVKGLLQVSRSIADAYLKKPEFNREPLFVKFRLREPFKRLILSAEPSISVHELQDHDQFLIFASDGLWEHLSNQVAVDVVQNHPRNGTARRLVKAALQVAANKREMRYLDLKKIERGVQLHIHDDITVVVIFLDSNLVSKGNMNRGSTLSLRGGGVSLPARILAPVLHLLADDGVHSAGV